jgi:phage minor structural protein
MIPILYESSETEFVSNGLCRLRDCTQCIVTEERNGIYECEFSYPVDGANYDKIKLGRIIAVEHDDSNDVQPFDIYSYSRPLNGVVTFYAKHISYRQSKMTAYGTNISGISAAFDILKTASPDNPFEYWSDISGVAYMAAADGVPRSVRSMLGGVEGSILDTFGGEYEWDKWTVKLWSRRGEDKYFSIRYGVNMLDFNESSDYGDSYSAVVPYWTGDNEIVIGDMILSDGISYTGRVDCVPLDVTEKFETKPTKAQVENMADSILQSKQPYLPQQTITVDFVRLQDSDEYARLINLQNCKLCDSVIVTFPRYGVEGRFKIVKTVYNVLLEKFDKMELGSLSTSLAEALGISEGSTHQKQTSVIVEQGTSGKWFYEKYSNKTLKAWYNSGNTTVTTGTSSGNGWFRNTNAYTIAIPAALNCASIKYASIIARNDLANMITSITGISTSQLSYYVSHLGELSDKSSVIMAEIIGTWS